MESVFFRLATFVCVYYIHTYIHVWKRIRWSHYQNNYTISMEKKMRLHCSWNLHCAASWHMEWYSHERGKHWWKFGELSPALNGETKHQEKRLRITGLLETVLQYRTIINISIFQSKLSPSNLWMVGVYTSKNLKTFFLPILVTMALNYKSMIYCFLPISFLVSHHP